MARQSKCTTCKESFPTEELTIDASKKYCAKCLIIRLATKEAKKSDWDILFQYICKVYNVKTLTGMMFMQLKQFRGEGYNYTDIGMYCTLKYFYGTLEKPLKDGTGLGIIPYYYEKAKVHFSKIYDMQDLAESIIMDEKIISIKTKQTTKAIKRIAPLTLEVVRKDDDDEETD